jgi:hypothetical protein
VGLQTLPIGAGEIRRSQKKILPGGTWCTLTDRLPRAGRRNCDHPVTDQIFQGLIYKRRMRILIYERGKVIDPSPSSGAYVARTY